MKILYVINKMTNLAGIERILTCKMNYLSEKPEYDVYLLTYEQPDQALSFQINEKVNYCPINAPLPQSVPKSLSILCQSCMYEEWGEAKDEASGDSSRLPHNRRHRSRYLTENRRFHCTDNHMTYSEDPSFCR